MPTFSSENIFMFIDGLLPIIGTIDIDSTPPTTNRSSNPERIFIAPRFTASSPDAQNRLIWTPATLAAQSATSAAVLAISAP